MREQSPRVRPWRKTTGRETNYLQQQPTNEMREFLFLSKGAGEETRLIRLKKKSCRTEHALVEKRHPGCVSMSVNKRGA